MNGYERNFNLLKAVCAGPCLLKDTMQLNSFFKDTQIGRCNEC